MNKFKIAVVSSGNIPTNWANSINTVKHAGGFCDLGNDVTVFSPLRLLEFLNLKNIKNLNNFYDINNKVNFKLITDSSLYFFNNRYGKIILNYFDKITFCFFRKIFDIEKKICKRVKEGKYDFAYCRSYRGAIYLVNCNIPTIVEIHSPEIKNSDLKRLLNMGENKAFIAISTISEELKIKFVKFGFPEDKIIVQDDAVDVQKYELVKKTKKEIRTELCLPINKKIITYCGSLRRGKGIFDLLRLAESMSEERDVLFLIVGGPESRKKYFEKLVISKGFKNIVFKGFVENKLVPRYLKSSDCLVMLYNINEERAIMDIETTSPIKLFEYLASKTPFVITDIKVSKRILGKEHEALVKMGNIDFIKNKVKWLLNNGFSQDYFCIAERHTYKKRCLELIKLI